MPKSVAVSDKGRVRDVKTKALRTPTLVGEYESLIIGGHPVFVHNLVMLTFVGQPPIDKPVPRGVQSSHYERGD